MSFGNVKQNILTLSLTNLIIGAVEFVFNMYLSRIYGPNGLGLLSLVSPINCIFLSFMTQGVVITISKTSARLNERREFSTMNTTIFIATVASFAWAFLLAILLMASAGFIATNFLKDSSLSAPILATVPLMLLMSLSNILKGHFLGLSKIKIPAAINIAEKLLRFPVLYLLIRFFLNSTSFPSITLVFLCYAIGEIQSVVLLFIYYRFTTASSEREKIDFDVVKRRLSPLIKGAAPICLTQCLLEFSNALSSIIVKSRLCSIGLSVDDAVALLGKYSGMVAPLMTFPMIIIASAGSIVIPKISALNATGKHYGSKRLVMRSFKFAVLIGLITAIVFWGFSSPMEIIFYKRDDLDVMIRMAGLIAPLLYLAMTSVNLLIGIGKEALSFRNTLIQQGLLLILLYLFIGIKPLNIYGYFPAILISNFALLLLNIRNLKESLK